MLKTLICLLCIYVISIEACSTFLLENKLAKSYDWIVEDGLIMVNKRHIFKQAMPADNPLQWTSKYGSITFTQAGRELPMGGMNETGLTIELMWLEETTYPFPDARPTVYELQWIQYQLDTASSVEEVIASDHLLRIDRNSKSLLHFIIVDNSGNVAIIEFINGEMVPYTKNEMPLPVLTNNTYQASLEHLNASEELLPEGFNSLDRFVRISQLLQEPPKGIKGAFSILSSVSNFSEAPQEEATFENMEKLMRTKWNIVYDIPEKEIHFLTKSGPEVRVIRLNAFNFDGGTEAQIFDIQNKLIGDISHYFVPYTYETNRNLIDRYYNQVPFLRDLSDEIRELTARYPETTYHINL